MVFYEKTTSQNGGGVLLVAILALSVSFVGCSDDDDDDDNGGSNGGDQVTNSVVYTHFMIAPACVTADPDGFEGEKQYYTATKNEDEYTYTFVVKETDGGWGTSDIPFKLLRVPGSAKPAQDDWNTAFGGGSVKISGSDNNTEGTAQELEYNPSGMASNAGIVDVNVGDSITIHVKVNGQTAKAWVTVDAAATDPKTDTEE